MSLEIIDEATVRSAVTLSGAREVVRAALISVSEGSLVAPDELAMRLPHGGELHVKGAHLDGSPWIAFKVATGGFPQGGNSGGTMVLEAVTGAPRYFLADGGWLTEIRTAAAAAVASKALAIDDVANVAIVGTGIQAGYQIAAHREALPHATFTAWGRNEDHARSFAERHEVDRAESLAEALDGADIVVTTTSARTPVLHVEHVHPGLHITAMGSDVPDKQELHADVVRRAEVVAADDVDVTRRVGELHHAPDVVDRAVDLGAILSGRNPGRTDGDQVTLCDLSGLGAEDAAMADLVLRTLGLS